MAEEPKKVIKVAFVGAGGVNFGGHGNAWDHASRIEKIPNVKVVGIAELNKERGEEVLAKRRFKHPEFYETTRLFADYRDMLRETKPDAVIIGLPPNVHGGPNFPVELDCVKAGAHILIEKPICNLPPENLEEYRQALEDSERNGAIISVAYMFRYSKVFRAMKEIAQQCGPIKFFSARYNCAYTNISAPAWWNKVHSGGPIVEQATHFLDLARYFCGEIDKDTVKCTILSSMEPLGDLSQVPVDESSIPPENRTNRVTSSMWKFQTGAVGVLTHTVMLHGWRYELHIELFGDGFYVYVHNPYDECRITVRRPGREEEEITTMPDDPYLHEVECFIDAVRRDDNTNIASTYADAFKSYDLSWKIQRASEI